MALELSDKYSRVVRAPSSGGSVPTKLLESAKKDKSTTI
jgi:hypothetical protein